jgi:hypothetical protein
MGFFKICHVTVYYENDTETEKNLTKWWIVLFPARSASILQITSSLHLIESDLKHGRFDSCNEFFHLMV